MKKIPSMFPSMPGRGHGKSFEERVCAAVRHYCPMIESIYCAPCPTDESLVTLWAVNSLGAEKEVCSWSAALSEDQVCSIVDLKTKQFLNQEAICALIGDKTKAFLDESAICNLIIAKSIKLEKILFKAGESLPELLDGVVSVVSLEGGIVNANASDELPLDMVGAVIFDPVSKCAYYSEKIKDRIVFCALDFLPKTATCPVIVCLKDGTEKTLIAGQQLPSNIDGSVIMDPLKCQPQFLQNPVKLLKQNYEGGDTMPEHAVGSVAVCLSDDSIVSLASGDSIPANIRGVVNVDQTDGTLMFSQFPLKAIPDTFALPSNAQIAGTDVYGVDYEVGDKLIVFPGGASVCVPDKVVDTDIDTWAFPGAAEESGVDAYGVPFAAGDPIIAFPNGAVVCVPKKVVDTNTSAIPSFASADGVDHYGIGYVANDPIITFPNGAIVCVPEKVVDTDTDTAARPAFAEEAGTDAYGVTYAAGDGLVFFPDGSVLCVPAKVVDTDTVSVPSRSEVSGTDVYGIPFAAGDKLITFPDGTTVCVPEKIVDTDTNPDPIFATAEGVDFYGVPYSAGDSLIEFPNGSIVCVPEKVVDTNTFGEPEIADVSGVDIYGVSYAINDKLIVFPNGSIVCVPEKVVDTDTDTWGVPQLAGAAGVDAYGIDYDVNDKIIIFPGNIVVCVPEKIDLPDTEDAELATESGADTFGRPYAANDLLLTLTNGKVICIPSKGDVVVPENPSISLVKTITNGPGPFMEGDVIDYNLAVENDGDVDLINSLPTDPLITVSGTAVDLAVGAIDNTSFTGSYTVTAADVTATEIVNNASVTGESPLGVIVSDTSSVTAPTSQVAENPSISLTKEITSGVGPYFEGDTIDYSFIVENTGDVDLSNVVVTDPLLTVSGGPATLAVSDIDNTSFTGSYTVTAADAAEGSVDNTASVEGVSPQSVVVTDTSMVSATTDVPVANKLCGVLPEVMAIAEVVSTSNPLIAHDGDTHNIDSVSEHRTAGGVLLATIAQTTNFISGNYLVEKDPVNPGAVDAHVFYTRPAGVNRSGFANEGIGQATVGNIIANVIEVGFSVTDEIGAGMTINGCVGTARSEIHLVDVDNSSQVSNLSRPWDDISQPFGGQSALPPTEDPAGTFTFGTQMNAYIDWDADLADEDQVALTYHQHASDAMLSWSQIYYTPAVCFTRDENGDIDSAETIDGPLDPSRWPEIIPS